MTLPHRRPGPILLVILGYTALSVYEPAWRVVLRGLFEGDEFSWGLGPIGGTGVGGDYWVLLAILAYGLLMLGLGWRGAWRAFRWLAFPWALFLVAQSAALSFAPDVEYVGETIGVALPLGALLLAVDLAYLALLGVWTYRRRGIPDQRPRPTWRAINMALLLAAAAMMPAIWWLLAEGPQHGPTDQLAVVLTLGQWVTLNAALYPWSGSRRQTLNAGG